MARLQDGGMAMEAFLEALSPQVSATRKAEIERQFPPFYLDATLKSLQIEVD